MTAIFSPGFLQLAIEEAEREYEQQQQHIQRRLREPVLKQQLSGAQAQEAVNFKESSQRSAGTLIITVLCVTYLIPELLQCM